MSASEKLKAKIEKFLYGFSLDKEPAFASSLNVQSVYGCDGGCTGNCLGCTSCMNSCTCASA